MYSVCNQDRGYIWKPLSQSNMESLLSFPRVWIRRTLSLSVNVLLSSVATFCPHFLFTENSFDFWYDSGKTFAKWAKSFDSFVERPVSKYMLITHAIFLRGSTANGVWVGLYVWASKWWMNFCFLEDYTICYSTYPPSTSTSWNEGWAFMKGLRYSPLHVTEFCGEMQGKFKVGLARLIIYSAKLSFR